MNRITDIHTHHAAPQPEAVVCSSPELFAPVEGQLYSIGIHPWDIPQDISKVDWEKFLALCSHPQVCAIGECGIDKAKGGPLFLQMQVLKQQIEISERLKKPLVIHDVKAHDIIIGMKKEFRPSQKWVVHGFNGKPSVAKMLIDAGIWLSFGPRFNPDSVKSVPEMMMLAETDDSDATIRDVISSLSVIRGTDISDTIALNASRFLSQSD